MIAVRFIAALAIPLGQDLYMPVPDENPITKENRTGADLLTQT